MLEVTIDTRKYTLPERRKKVRKALHDGLDSGIREVVKVMTDESVIPVDTRNMKNSVDAEWKGEFETKAATHVEYAKRTTVTSRKPGWDKVVVQRSRPLAKKAVLRKLKEAGVVG